MAGINTYKKKIAQYIDEQEKKSKEAPSSKTGKGLLAPKEMKKEELQKQKTSIDYVSEYVYALRKQRNIIKAERSKK